MKDELKRFKTDLQSDKKLVERLEQILTEMRNSAEPQNDREALAIAAAELGYNFSAVDLEHAQAEAEELDTAELNQVPGGSCFTDWGCSVAYHNGDEDEKGHDNFCWTVWHCYAASMHTETESKVVPCWSDYKCIVCSSETIKFN